MEENQTPTPQTPETEKAPTTEQNLYALDARSHDIVYEYTEQKFKLVHSFGKADPRELVQYYLASPSVKSYSKGENKMLGTPTAPAAILHDQSCVGVKQVNLSDKSEKVLTLEQVRELRQSFKGDAVAMYLGGLYDVELSVESGDMDDLLFDRTVKLTATVKTRPSGGKVDKVFKIFLNRPDDLTMERFVSHASGTSVIDKSDEMLSEFLGEDNLAEMTGGVDEGERVAFSKTTTYVRQYLDIFDKSFDGAEDATIDGQPYSNDKRNASLKAIDPVLKIAVAQALRNFI